MPYFDPYIDDAGLHIPTYSEVRDSLISEAKGIFGQDIYLEPDSMDYQYISAIAAKIYSTYQLCQTVFNDRSPLTALGVGLDSIVKLNGLERRKATNSVVSLTITGTPSTVITGGVAQDINGSKWLLPELVTIPAEGSIEVSATAEDAGAITAAAHTITTIANPTYGWDSVDNANPATPGQDVETDPQLKARQAVSTESPSVTVLEGTLSEVLAYDDVIRAKIYENNTSSTDTNGLPPHSISLVVDGGDDQEIANTIYLHKTPGCNTYGSTTIVVSSIYGFTTPISFFHPTKSNIYVSLTVKALHNYTDEITSNIKTSIAEYLNNLDIGEEIVISSLWYAASLAQPNQLSPAFSITNVQAGRSGGSLGSIDIDLLFNEAAVGNVENITLTLV